MQHAAAMHEPDVFAQNEPSCRQNDYACHSASVYVPARERCQTVDMSGCSPGLMPPPVFPLRLAVVGIPVVGSKT